MKVILQYEHADDRWYSHIELGGEQVVARLGPFHNGMDAAKGIFHTYGTPQVPEVEENELLGG